MRTRILLLVIALIGTAALPVGAQSSAEDEGVGSANIQPVLNLPHGTGENPGGGSDIEFFTISYSLGAARERLGMPPRDADMDGTLRNGVQRQYALAGTTGNGMHVYDITDPEATFPVSSYDCSANQGDSQIFTRTEGHRVRTYTTYTTEDSSGVTGACAEDIGAPDAGGTLIIDISDPYAPRSVAFIDVPEGSHNGTVHPSGEYFYNSNSSLYTDTAADGGPGIEYYDIRDFGDIQRLGRLALPPIPASLGTESHDITFNEAGDRAYSAALSQGVIIDTTDPAAPSIVTTFVDPTINVWHQADPITVGGRELLVVEDEFVGATGTGQCPNGGVHVFDISNELVPVKIGYWNIDEPRVMALDGSPAAGGCTAHVFRLYPEAGLMTIAYYNGGVRVVDLNGLEGVGLGGTALPGVGDPMVQTAFHRFTDSNSWAAKTPGFAEDGSFYLFSNDRDRGLDVYRVDGTTDPEAAAQGTWLSAAAAAVQLPRVDQVDLQGYRMFCLLQGL